MTRTRATALIFAAAAVAGAAGTAEAIDVRKHVELSNHEGGIWGKIGAFCAIKDWHPALSNCEESKDGDVVRRVLTLKDGGQIKEKFTGKIDTEKSDGYSYVIEESPLPVKNYKATFSIEPMRPPRVIVTWEATFDANGKPDDEAKKIIEGIFEAGLANLEKTFPLNK